MFFKALGTAISFALVLQLLLPVLEPPGMGRVSAAPKIPAAPPALLHYAPRPQDNAQEALDMLVQQLLPALDWQVNTVRSELDESSWQNDLVRQTGRGTWHVEVRDENNQPQILEGQLDFEIVVHLQGRDLTGADISLKGTLENDTLTLALDAATTGEAKGDLLEQTAKLDFALTRGGQTSQLAITNSSESRVVAYNLTQTITRATTTRDGRRGETNQTINSLALGHGESELWLRADASEDDGATPTTIELHLFQRIAGAHVDQYIDRFEFMGSDRSYSLREPTSVRSTLDSNASYDFEIHDAQGNPIRVSSPTRPTNWIPRRAPGNSSIVPSARGGVPVPESRVRLPAGMNAAGWVPPNSLQCNINILTAVLSGAAALGLAGGFFLYLVKAGLFLNSPASIILMGAYFWPILIAATALGLLAAIAYTAYQANHCNPDPYFVTPDTRPNPDELIRAPLHITRVTGGLTSPKENVNAPPPGQVSFESNGISNYSYRDRAELFVVVAAPPGAQTLGDWITDRTHTFRGSPTHTSTPVQGSQKHYFINAAQPLTLDADDNLVQYVYLDPEKPPSEILLQFYTGDGDGEHRAYWGADRIQTGGASGSAALYPMGALPGKGAWVRLKIPADQVGLVGKEVHGVLYAAYDGQTWWGPTTTSSRATDTAPAQLVIADVPLLPETIPGAQVAFRLTQPAALNVRVVDLAGKTVRTLIQNETRLPNYYVVTWDAKDESGNLAADAPYRVQLRADETLVEAPLTITPFVANIASPHPYSVVRGLDVPIYGEAFGTQFDRYIVEYGEGLDPTEWIKLVESSSAAQLPSAGERSHIQAGNLANWDVGLNEIGSRNADGLNGVYTLRLRVVGGDGREASDVVPVFVGRLISTGKGGTVSSPDGKARLVVPPITVADAFSLMAIVPASQSDPGGTWENNLPPDKSLASEVYEIFPADEVLRGTAVLELALNASSPTEQLGILLGDGTREGWRYIGGTVDPDKGVIRVPLAEFGGTRALVGVFVADDFGPPVPLGRVGDLAFDSTQGAPTISLDKELIGFYSDLTANAGEWSALDSRGTELVRVDGAEAGLAAGSTVLKVTRGAEGARVVRVRATPYDAVKYPLLSFDYRVASDYAPNLLIRSNGAWWQLDIGTSKSPGSAWNTRYFPKILAPPLVADDTWHHYQVDLLGLLRLQDPSATSYQVDEIALGQLHSNGYLQTVPGDDGAVGSAYYLANFAAHAPTNATTFNLTVSAPTGIAFDAYSLVLDQKPVTVPPANVTSASNIINVSLPDNAGDGVWYVHVRGRRANGEWSAPGHLALVLDRTPPEIGQPDPPLNGAGSPEVISVPMVDAHSGIDKTAIQLELNGNGYGFGRGLRYDPVRRDLQIVPSQLNPAPPFIGNGQRVSLSLTRLRDYAGNPVAAPFRWSFTADRPRVAGDEFRQLTVDGGQAPSLAPDGSQLAFVSDRSGVSKVWVMNTDDFEEANNSARLLTNTDARESDPAWSSDGKQLAFVSDADGSSQIWVANADSSGARALTAGEGAVASPTWSPDSRTIAFIRDGNLWQVSADGSNPNILTRLPEQPFRAARWQPDGSQIALAFNLYQETVELYDLATGELHSITVGGVEREPAWLNANALLYSAPATDGALDAVWQVSGDGSGASILAGSGLTGIADMQPIAALNGGAVAIVSTRSGARNVWLRANFQIARLDVSPAEGAPPGTPLQITYVLPADAQVTLEIVGVKSLLDAVPQSKGLRTVFWDGTGADGKPLPAGAYAFKLSAQLAGGEPLERFASARILDAADIGTLALQVNQWANQPLDRSANIKVQVYPAGTRGRPVSEVPYEIAPLFKLPAGEYDVAVTLDTVRREFNRLTVLPGQTINQALDLQLGGLEVTLLKAPGQPVDDFAVVRVVRSDDTARTLVAVKYEGVSNFVLPPARYDVFAEYQGVEQELYRIEVKTGQVHHQEINLGAGTLALSVLAFGGTPAESGTGRLQVQVFESDNHDQPVATSYNNPAELLVPAGRYDVRIRYDATQFSTHHGGTVENWLYGINLRSGETVSQTYRIAVGQLHIDFVEAEGKPVDANQFSFRIFPRGSREDYVAFGISANEGTFVLAPGEYEIVPSHDGVERSVLPATPIGVRDGATLTQTINLHLGQLHIAVNDVNGQPVAAERIYAYAYPSGARDTSLGNSFRSNPLVLRVPMNMPVDVVVQLDGAGAELNGLEVGEGQILNRSVGANEFK